MVGVLPADEGALFDVVMGVVGSVLMVDVGVVVESGGSAAVVSTEEGV